MKLILILFISLFSVSILNAKLNIDSLLTLIEQEKQDTTILNLRLKVAQSYSNQQPDLAFPFIDTTRILAKKLNDKSALASLYIFEATAFARKIDFEKSNENLYKAIELSSEIKDSFVLADAYLTLGINYLRTSSYDSSATNLHKSLKICQDTENYDILVSNYVSLALLNKDLNKTDACLDYLRRALDAYNHLTKQNTSKLSLIYNNMASTFLEFKQTDSALFYLDQAIEIDLAEDDKRGLSIEYHNKGAIYYDEGDFNKALEWLQKAKDIKVEMGYEEGIAISDIALADIYIEIKNYETAKKYLDSALPVLKKMQSQRHIINAYRDYSTIYTNLKDFEKANEYLTKFYKLKDSVYSESKEKTIADLESKFDLSQKEKENEKLLMEAERRNYILIISLLGFLVVVVSLISLYFKNKSMKRMNIVLQENNERIEKQNEELEALNDDLAITNHSLTELNSMKDKFFSIISHDLRSPISSLFNMINMLQDDYDEIEEKDRIEYIDMLYDTSKSTYSLLENLLTWSRSQLDSIRMNKEKVNLYDLVENTINHLKGTAEIKHINLENKISSDLILKIDASMISTVIRNLINNSIKFTEENGSISVEMRKNGDHKAIISIIDTGIGMEEDRVKNLFQIDKAKSTNGTNNEKGTGLGLIICKEFVDKHDGKIWAESKLGVGTKFHISLPE